MKNILPLLSIILLITATGPSASELVMSDDATGIEKAGSLPETNLSHSFLSIHPPHSAGGAQQSLYVDHIRSNPRRTHAPSLFPSVFNRLFTLEHSSANEHPAIHLPHCSAEHFNLYSLRSVILLI
jgi:hypothetical protein